MRAVLIWLMAIFAVCWPFALLIAAMMAMHSTAAQDFEAACERIAGVTMIDAHGKRGCVRGSAFAPVV